MEVNRFLNRLKFFMERCIWYLQTINWEGSHGSNCSFIKVLVWYFSADTEKTVKHSSQDSWKLETYLKSGNRFVGTPPKK
jgi:hypothetical protein